MPLPQFVVLEQEHEVLVRHELLATHLKVLEDPVFAETKLQVLDLEKSH